jgi:class 3 adenylate cyclase
VREIWGRFGDVIARHRAGVLFRNTWGDGLYIVVAAAPLAAELALELQEVFRALDLAAHGLPDHLGLRLGGHIGPVFEMRDAILDVNNFMGVHVSRTARIEPVTPVGAVYVTEPFAAALALSQDSRFACEYVGQAPAAKGYGVMRFYSLKRAAPPAAH